MKKLAIAATLAVLFGGISSLYAQVIPSMPYDMKLEAQRINEQNIKEHNALSQLIHRAFQQGAIGLRHETRYMRSYTGASCNGGGTCSQTFTKAYPATQGTTFDAHVYTEQNTNYIIISDKTWGYLSHPEENANTLVYYHSFSTPNGEKKYSVHGPLGRVQQCEVNGVRYKVISLPRPEGSKE